MKPIFHLPYNNDPRLIDIILSDYSENVGSFYGSFGIDPFGSGRAMVKDQYSSLISYEKMMAKINSKDIDFNYVINGIGLNNNEFKPEFIKLYKNFITDLMSIGLKMITLCNLYLIKITKELFPTLKISASVNFKTRSLREVQYILNSGCDEMTLHYDLIDNFKELKSIVNSTSCTLKIIPNDLYIYNCPWQKGHTRMQASHSRMKTTNTPYFSYYRNKCVNIRHYYPEEIIKAKWISPLTVRKYLEIGLNNFKLLDRLATTEWIINSLNVYLTNSTISNLEEILGTYGNKRSIEISRIDNFEEVYPRKCLELIPNIDFSLLTSKIQNIYKYKTSEEHPTECSTCRMCRQVSTFVVGMTIKDRLTAIENNYNWQKQITKKDFVDKLNSSTVQRITYKK